MLLRTAVTTFPSRTHHRTQPSRRHRLREGRGRPRSVALLAVTAIVLSIVATAPTAAAAAATGRITGIVTGPVTCASVGGPYPDVSTSNPHCDNIWWMSGTGITRPIGGKYYPGNNVTRGSMTAFLFRLTHPGKASPPCTKKPFPDVATSNVFCGYITWAANNGIAFGYPDGTFGPSRAVTRGAMAAFLHRIAEPAAPRPCISKPFTDVGVRDTFCAVIGWMKRTGITYGVGGGRYGTAEPVTRQSMASFLRRMVSHTDAAPGIGNAQLGPVAGATVVITAADTSGRYYLVTTNRDGSYTASGVVPGRYKVCVDGSTVTSGLPTGYSDACYRNVAWPFDSPRAPNGTPAVTVRAGQTTSGIGTTLRAAASALKHHRGVTPTLSKKSSQYRFLLTQGDSQKPVTYNPCQPIHYVVRWNGAPAGSGALVESAIQRVSRATGLRFIYDGATSEDSDLNSRATYQPKRYGDRWAPLLINWTDANKYPLLGGYVIGLGGSASWQAWNSTYTSIAMMYTTGAVLLDTPDIASVLKDGYSPDPKGEVRAVIMHELGHVVGLGHINDENQIMNPYSTDLTTWGLGDRTGLAAVGQGQCLSIDPASTAQYLTASPSDAPFLP